jgi:hypothetical protein
MTIIGFGEEPYMTVPQRRVAALGHHQKKAAPKDTPASFWHVCCETAWSDHNPNPAPCFFCGRPAPQATLNDLMRNVQARGSEACPSLNGEHTAGTLY